jgi:hypothetical protein
MLFISAGPPFVSLIYVAYITYITTYLLIKHLGNIGNSGDIGNFKYNNGIYITDATTIENDETNEDK